MDGKARPYQCLDEPSASAFSGRVGIRIVLFELLRLHSRYGPHACSTAVMPKACGARRRPLSRGFDGAGCPTTPPVSYQLNRQLAGWNPPPQVFRAFEAHQRLRTMCVAEAVFSSPRMRPQHFRKQTPIESRLKQEARQTQPANFLGYLDWSETNRRAAGHNHERAVPTPIVPAMPTKSSTEQQCRREAFESETAALAFRFRWAIGAQP